MYKQNNSNTIYNPTAYQNFVNKSLERLAAHFGNYTGTGEYQPQPFKRNKDYDSFK